MADLNVSVYDRVVVFDDGRIYKWRGWDGSAYAYTLERCMAVINDRGRIECRAELSSAESHSGTHSLKVRGGGFHDLFYACDAGSQSVKVWVKFESGASPRLEVLDGREAVGVDTPTGDGSSWEELVVNFTAEKKTYIVRLANYGTESAYFDDVT